MKIRPDITVIPRKGKLTMVIWWSWRDWKRLPAHIRPKAQRKTKKGVRTTWEMRCLD